MAHLIQPKELKSGDMILDLRTQSEYNAFRLGMKHIWIPLEQLDVQRFVHDYHIDPQTPIYLLCRSGKRAAIAAQMFEEIGYPNVFVIDGGILNAMNQRVKVISYPEFRPV